MQHSGMRKTGKYLSSAAFAAILYITSPLAAHASIWLKTGPETSKPYGHIEYCARHRSECGGAKRTKALPPARLSLLGQVNRTVNKAIKPVADIRQFGKHEYWTSNTNAGDCEDYALAKRARLLRSGYRASDLLLTMAHSRGEAHTVLIVRTRDGDFVLDNKLDDVLPVNATGLGYVKMQSDTNQAQWLRITGKTSQLP